jgi:outer membrane protein OmpA-like peptidoglycan-associated protein/serine/threonine protein kinase
MKLNKRLDEIYDIANDTRIDQSTYGVILEIRRKDGEDAVFALKTVQTRDLDEQQESLSPTELQNIDKAIKREIEFLSTLEQKLGCHPARLNILPLVDCGLWSYNGYDRHDRFKVFKDGFPAFVMPKGIGLGSLVKSHFRSENKHHPVSSLDFLRWTLQAATAIAAVHTLKDDEGKGYVHRDIKPSNLILVDNTIYLIDFGAIKLLKKDRTKSFMGSPYWMAPELALPFSRNESDSFWEYKFGPPSDLYSLGLVMFWLATVEENFTYLDSQVDIARKISSFGDPVTDAHKHWGKLGGMNERERERLKKRLNELFNVPESTGTGMRKEKNKRPVVRNIAESVFHLIERLLTIDPTTDPTTKPRRPTAKEVIEETKNLIGRFIATSNPQIELPPEVGLKEPVIVKVTVTADWLPPGTEWLDVSMDGTPAQKIEPAGPGLWMATMAEPGSEGKYEVHAEITLEGIRVESPPSTVRVTATAEQLWNMGKYAEALIKDPDREEWLDWIRAETEGNGEKCCQWSKMLQEVYKAFEEDGTLREHKRFSREFFRLEHECEEHGKKKNYPPPPVSSEEASKGDDKKEGGRGNWNRYAVIVAVFVLLFALELGYMNWLGRQESTEQDVEVGTTGQNKQVLISEEQDELLEGKNISNENLSDNNGDHLDKSGILPKQIPDNNIIIYFKYNSNELLDDALIKLDEVAEIMAQNPDTDIIIKGHTDSFGFYDYNKELSLFKANIVKSFLTSKGINPRKIKTIGMGPDNPIDTNETAKGRRINRRVEIEFLNKKLAEGNYEIIVSAEGYETQRKPIIISSNEDTSIKVTLAAKKARLFVKTRPEGATIKVMNIKPKFYQGMELDEGYYKIEATLDGYLPGYKEVLLQKGEIRDVNIDLIKKADPFERGTNEENLYEGDIIITEDYYPTIGDYLPGHTDERGTNEENLYEDDIIIITEDYYPIIGDYLPGHTDERGTNEENLYEDDIIITTEDYYPIIGDYLPGHTDERGTNEENLYEGDIITEDYYPFDLDSLTMPGQLYQNTPAMPGQLHQNPGQLHQNPRKLYQNIPAMQLYQNPGKFHQNTPAVPGQLHQNFRPSKIK